VIGFVRHPEQLRELFALGLEPSVEIADLFNCAVVISMLPDDRSVREVVFGHDAPFRRDGLALRLARRHSPFDEHDQHHSRI
jgi:3-hydroxyisobutyrate dehydrogenase-like beta-hydroxyacid dehydrogenase